MVVLLQAMASAVAKSITPGADYNKDRMPKITPNKHVNNDLTQQAKDSRRRYLDEVHRADTEFSKGGAPRDMFKLIRSVILPRPLLWSEFVKKFVFGRPQELREKLCDWRCKHILVRCVVFNTCMHVRKCKKIAPITHCGYYSSASISLLSSSRSHVFICACR